MYNSETKEYPREPVSEYDEKLIIDGVIVKKGCDREYAQVNIHSFE